MVKGMSSSVTQSLKKPKKIVERKSKWIPSVKKRGLNFNFALIFCERVGHDEPQIIYGIRNFSNPSVSMDRIVLTSQSYKDLSLIHI